jgi:hypothetical protein
MKDIDEPEYMESYYATAAYVISDPELAMSVFKMMEKRYEIWKLSVDGIPFKESYCNYYFNELIWSQLEEICDHLKINMPKKRIISDARSLEELLTEVLVAYHPNLIEQYKIKEAGILWSSAFVKPRLGGWHSHRMKTVVNTQHYTRDSGSRARE